MSDLAIKVEHVGKQYRLGMVGTGTISHDINRWWYKIRGKEDPYLKIGETNDRTTKGNSDLVWALKDINFEVKQGEVLGIIGKNGAGKSTLLKILSRVTSPTVGEIKVRGRIASLLEVGTGFHPELTGRENIFLNGAILGMTKHEIIRKFDEIVSFSGVERYIDTPVKRYSSGMYVRLAFAVAAHLEPEILIVDEVLAVGDAEFQKKCLGKMKDVSGQGRTVLFVSHNMSAIKSFCTRVILMEKGGILDCPNKNYAIERYLDLNNYTKDKSIISFPLTDKHIQILEASIIDSNGNVVSNQIDVEENYYVEIKYKVKKKVLKAHLTLIIADSSGEIIYFLDRRDVETNYAVLEIGEYKSKISIQNPLLKPGKYHISLGFSDEDEMIEDHKFQVLSFTIIGSTIVRGERDGFLYLPTPWQLNKIAV